MSLSSLEETQQVCGRRDCGAQNTSQEAQVKGDRLWLREPGAPLATHRVGSACQRWEEAWLQAHVSGQNPAPRQFAHPAGATRKTCRAGRAARTWLVFPNARGTAGPGFKGAARPLPREPPALGPRGPHALPPAAVSPPVRAAPQAPARHRCRRPAPPYLAKQNSQWLPRSLIVST